MYLLCSGGAILENTMHRIVSGTGDILLFKDVYCTDRIYRVYKNKLQNCFCNQFE